MLVHYVGQVTEIVESCEELVVNCLRREGKCFIFPENSEESVLPVHDVERVLPEPHTWNA